MNRSRIFEQGLAVLEARLKNASPSGQRIPCAPDAVPFVTLSRETAAGATTIGSMLVPLMNRALGEPGQGWALLDKNLINCALAQQNLPERLAEHLPEDKISEIEAVIGELVGLHPPIWELEHQIVAAILQLAQAGRVILVGRGSAVITRSLPGGFHVRLVAPLGVRAGRMMDVLQCDEGVAREHIFRTDRARQRFFRTHFGGDLDDPRFYDLVANTGRVPPEIVAQLIVTGLTERIRRLQASPAAYSQPPATMSVGF